MGGRRGRALVVAVLAAVGTAGLGSCGGGPERLTPTELAARGNAVCARSDEKLQKAFSEELAGENPTAKQKQAVLQKVAPIFEGTVAGLRKLEPPESLETRFDAALEEAEEAIEVLDKAAASPEAAEKLFSDPEDPFADANKGFEAVGIRTCSQGAGEAGGAGGTGEVEFRATEYGFTGPVDLSAGKLTISLANRGREAHEMTIVRLAVGVTARQVMDAEAAGQDTVDLVADDDVGAIGPLQPGAEDKKELDLVPGTYAYACFVDAPDGQSHVAKGMFGQFRVS